MMPVRQDIDVPMAAEVISWHQETQDVFTLNLVLTELNVPFQYLCGQIVMIYHFGVGEVPVAIVPATQKAAHFAVTIKAVGRVTKGLSVLRKGCRVGIRGPFGRGWPLKVARQKDLLIMTGGLGNLALLSAVEHLMQHRHDYGRITVLHGIKHSRDYVGKSFYTRWQQQPDTQVLLSTEEVDAPWHEHIGRMTTLLNRIEFDPERTLAMICGPEGMMIASVLALLNRGMVDQSLYVSLERNFECGIGHCGHCQLGGQFICKNGPVFCYADIKTVLGKKGF